MNRQAPHSDADTALGVHITLAVVWAPWWIAAAAGVAVLAFDATGQPGLGDTWLLWLGQGGI